MDKATISQKNKFLMKVFLGRETNLDNPNEIITKCIRNAYIDMLAAGRFFLKGNIENNCRQMEEILKRRNFEFSRGLIDEVSFLFGDTEIIGSGNKYVTRYGLAQKFVNMAFKNFYVCHEYIDRKIDFSKCDCPLDSVVLCRISSKIVWSKIKKEDYENCQKIINILLKNEEMDDEIRNLGNLAFDFLVW